MTNSDVNSGQGGLTESDESVNLEPAAYICPDCGIRARPVLLNGGHYRCPECGYGETSRGQKKEWRVYSASDIIQLIDNLLSEIDEDRFDSPKGAESVLLQLKSEIQSLEVED